MKKRKNRNQEIPAWIGSGRFLRIPFEKLDSEAGRSLTARQWLLFMNMARHYRGESRKSEVAAQFPEVDTLQGQNLFFFTQAEALQTGRYGGRDFNKHTFYKDMKALVDRGFIEIVAAGGRRSKTIYRFSSQWRNWKKPEPP